jgi:hypothetical protein
LVRVTRMPPFCLELLPCVCVCMLCACPGLRGESSPQLLTVYHCLAPHKPRHGYRDRGLTSGRLCTYAGPASTSLAEQASSTDIMLTVRFLVPPFCSCLSSARISRVWLLPLLRVRGWSGCRCASGATP